MFRMALVLCITVAPMIAAAEQWTFLATDADGGKPLTDAVILMPRPAEPVAADARMVQENRQFVPHVLVIPPGTEVSFPNRDNTQHHVYSFSPVKTFEIELYAGIPEAPIRFDTTGVVELGCNIHDHMQGFILVTDQQHGITNSSGEVSLDWPDDQPLPDQVRAWHPRLADTSRLMDVAIDSHPGEPVTVSLPVRPAPETDSSLDRLQQRFREL
ncbi:methylamine utilization protein [Marinobacter lacisalsi]|uniref:Methylamine utilization protein n=1 Tax=Marinobacter lacisalsi TaxID=475979 RepID=A0ABV8QB53_9GAMM